MIRLEPGDMLRGSLDHCVRNAMAWFTKRDQIRQIICGSVIGEKPERSHVVNVGAGRATMLTNAAVSPSRLSLLCHPVRPASLARPSFELGMQRANAMIVAANPSAEFSGTALANGAAHSLECRAAPDANESRHLFWLRPQERILARWRARFTSAVFSARRDHGEGIAAPLRQRLYFALFARPPNLSSIGDIATLIRAVFCRAAPVGFDRKWRAANDAIERNHRLILWMVP